MVVHLFPKSKFTEEFIGFINNNFDNNEHTFVLYTNSPFDLPRELYDHPNVFDYDKYNTCWWIKTLLKADLIIIHNLGFLFKELLVYAMMPSVCAKSIWMIWGSDLYSHRDANATLGEKLTETLKKTAIKRFPVIASLTDGDYDLAKEWYRTNAKNVRLDYCEENTIRLMNMFREKANRSTDDKTIRVLLGNSASRTNQHIEALELLSGFSDCDLQIFAPLSYGDPNYADAVCKKGKDLFGEKFIAITQYMSREQYYEFLSGIDIGIFNNNRQEGTGNIEALLYYGKKIFLRDDTTMWNEWICKKGYLLHSIEELRNIGFEEFAEIDKEELLVNSKLIEEYFNVDNRRKEWEKAFEMLNK